MDEFPTDNTAIMMTTFITLSNPLIPASLMAMTKGEALASDDAVPLSRRGSVYLTKRPIRVNETM